jgi:hypothetical protein
MTVISIMSAKHPSVPIKETFASFIFLKSQSTDLQRLN